MSLIKCQMLFYYSIGHLSIDQKGSDFSINYSAYVILANAGLKLGLGPNFKDGLNVGEGVGVEIFFSRKILVTQN